jgi:hypothetical protein
MSDLLSAGAAAMSGGVLGMIGTAIGRGVGMAERVLEDRQERARWQHEIALRQIDQTGRREAAADARLQAETEGTWKGLTATADADAALPPGYAWVAAVRALVRPTLTVLLWLVAAMVALVAVQRGELTAFARFADGVSFAAAAATLWWFGDRAPRR